MKQYLALIHLFSTMILFGQKDPAAEIYLDKISKDLDPGHALKIEFGYTREDLQSESKIEGEGTLVVMGEKYKMDLGEAIILFDGKKQYSLQTEIEEVYISIPDPENKEFMFSDPIRMLRKYKEDYKYRLMGEVTFNGKPAVEVQLYPEELGSPYALIKLYFTKENSKLNAMVIRHKEGILYTMLLKSMEDQKDPGIAFFQFNQEDYPNVDVIELMD